MASIRKIEGKDGVSYKITVSMGRDAQDKQIRRYKTWKPDRPMTARQMEKEVQRVAFEFERELSLGFLLDNRQTFLQYAEYFIETKQQAGASPRTIRDMRWAFARVADDFGFMKLADIRPQHLNKCYRKLMQPGGLIRGVVAFLRVDFDQLGSLTKLMEQTGLNQQTITALRDGRYVLKQTADKFATALGRKTTDLFRLEQLEKGLTQGSVRRIHSMISAVFAQAEKEMLIPYNPAARATAPNKRSSEAKVKVIQPEELSRVVDALELEPLAFRTLVYFLIVTGCRRGEVLALKWDKVDFQNGQVKIDRSLAYLKDLGIYEGPTKTRNTRFISLPPEMLRMLRQYRAWQSEQRLFMGPLWKDTGYVFTAPDGGAKMPDNVNSTLKFFCKRHKLPHIHPHMFRHTAASIMIARGVDILTVSKMLGHSKTSMTLDVYGHAIDEEKQKAAECIADVILRHKTS